MKLSKATIYFIFGVFAVSAISLVILETVFRIYINSYRPVVVHKVPCCANETCEDEKYDCECEEESCEDFNNQNEE